MTSLPAAPGDGRRRRPAPGMGVRATRPGHRGHPLLLVLVCLLRQRMIRAKDQRGARAFSRPLLLCQL
jgi:hypothetical protein